LIVAARPLEIEQMINRASAIPLAAIGRICLQRAGFRQIAATIRLSRIIGPDI
jgi:hypothetical protein